MTELISNFKKLANQYKSTTPIFRGVFKTINGDRGLILDNMAYILLNGGKPVTQPKLQVVNISATPEKEIISEWLTQEGLKLPVSLEYKMGRHGPELILKENNKMIALMGSDINIEGKDPEFFSNIYFVGEIVNTNKTKLPQQKI